jgi:hypothetical protein
VADEVARVEVELVLVELVLVEACSPVMSSTFAISS